MSFDEMFAKKMLESMKDEPEYNFMKKVYDKTSKFWYCQKCNRMYKKFKSDLYFKNPRTICLLCKSEKDFEKVKSWFPDRYE